MTVLLVGALLIAMGCAWYENMESARHKVAYEELKVSSHDKLTQVLGMQYGEKGSA